MGAQEESPSEQVGESGYWASFNQLRELAAAGELGAAQSWLDRLVAHGGLDEYGFRAQRLALVRHLCELYGLDCPLPAWVGKRAIPQSKVFIDAQHGLGNRLRAIASAAVLARMAGRELVVVWEPDHHCDCRFGDLFEYDGPVIDRSFLAQARERGMTVFNYMEIEEGAEKYAEILPRAGVDLYARSSDVLKSPLITWQETNRFLRDLKPVREVLDLVDAVDVDGRVGVHIRMEAGTGLDHNSYDSPDNWPAEAHEQLQYWRAKSHYRHFIRRIDGLIAAEPNLKLFLATDRAETYGIFEERYGDRLSYLKRPVYDRSREQIRYALADALLLSRCERFLGSHYSTFTELAMRLSQSMRHRELSGRDF